MRRLRLALSTSGLLRSCGVIESMIAICRLSTVSSRLRSASWFFILAMPGSIAISPVMPPMRLHLRQLLAQIGEIERALAHLLGDARRLLGIDGRGGFLDQRDDVAHAENAVGDALRIEILDGVELFAGADELDRLAGDRAHRQRGAAAAVAVDPGQHDAGEIEPLVEAFGQIDGVLAGQRVGDQQHLVRIGGAAHLRRFAHQLLVEREPAGGIEQHHVIAAEPRRLLGAGGDLHRRLAFDDRQRVDVDLLAEHGELLHRRRPAGVERGHQHLALETVGEALGDLGGGRGFARALQADHHDDDRRRRVEIDRLRVRSQSLDQLVVHDLHDHLAGRDRLDHVDADRALLHLLGEAARDVERHVGLEQRAPHFAQRRLDIGFRQRAAPGQPVEDAVQPFGEIVEHQKHLCARGRIALSGGNLRSPGPVGG